MGPSKSSPRGTGGCSPRPRRYADRAHETRAPAVPALLNDPRRVALAPGPCLGRRTLGVDHLVDRKLLDVRWRLPLDTGRRHSLDEPPREGIEVLAGLPEVDDPPPPPLVDRPKS